MLKFSFQPKVPISVVFSQRDNTPGHEQFRRFYECIDGNFLTQVPEEPTRRQTLLDLILTDKEGLFGL